MSAVRGNGRFWAVAGLGIACALAVFAVPATAGLVLGGCSLGLLIATVVLWRPR